MKRGGGHGGEVVVDPGGGGRALELLQVGHVPVHVPEKLLNSVDGVFATVAQDVEGTREDEMLILVGEDTSSL